MGGIDLGSEEKGKVVQVADGFWILATSHHPGGNPGMPEINNRAMIFRLKDNGEDVLAVFNAVDPGQMGKVHDLEKETGLSVKYVVSVGGGHHLLMNDWHDAFPEAQLKLGPIRVPRTTNGKVLMAMDRVSTMDLDDPLPQFGDELELVLFRGLTAGKDLRSVLEGASGGMLDQMAFMKEMMLGMKDPYDELWLFHKATGTLVGGENLGWMFTADEHKALPMMFRSLMKTKEIYIMEKFRFVGDATAVAACWSKILAWPAQTILSYHDTPGVGFTEGAHEALKTAVAATKQASA